MAYVPPHSKVKPAKIFKTEFPQLATPGIDEKPKLDFSKLFKNLIEKRKQKANKMKWGMIKLTKDGIIDSLTVEERAYEDFKHEDFLFRWNLEKLGARIETDKIRRMDEDPDYEPYVVDESSSEEEYVSEEDADAEAEEEAEAAAEEDEF